jgi:uncharacterized membrane protein
MCGEIILPILFLLGFLLIVGVPAATVYLLISNVKLQRRLTALEGAISAPLVQTVRTADMPPPLPQVQTRRAEAPDPVRQRALSGVPQVTTKTVHPPKAIVLHARNARKLAAWIMHNWFYAVSAASLALAGVFLVIYGAENGMMPPAVRILGAMTFGVGLIAAGEYIRRRYGDTEAVSTAYLPSTFSAAGIITLFGAILAARLLYDFIGPELALVGLALVGAAALVLGWFYGPLLAAVGIVGATAAPFVIGGSSDNPTSLFGYLFIVSVVGLAIDSVRRWGWISILTLVTGFTSALLLALNAHEIVIPFFTFYCSALALAAIAIPVRTLAPDHASTPLSLAIFARRKSQIWPEFPTRLAGGAVIAASAMIVMNASDTSRADFFWSAFIALTALLLGLVVWARRAPAIADLAAVPAAALVFHVATGSRVWAKLAVDAEVFTGPKPVMVSTIVVIAAAISAAAAWRSLRGGPAQVFMAALAALFAPAIAIAIEVFWQPADAIGTYLWALHAMTLGGLMVLFALRFERIDGDEDRTRVSLVTLSALACIAFGVTIMFTSAALTTALAVTLVAAAWLDRQFNLPLMGLYILAGVTTIGYRLVIDPGVEWAITTTWPQMLLSHGGAVLAFAAAWLFSKDAGRPRSEVLLESAIFSSTAILLSLILNRCILQWGHQSDVLTHWAIGIGATIWLALGFAQLRRMELGGALGKLRVTLGTLFLLIGGAQLVAAITVTNPMDPLFGDRVIGPAFINTLIPAFLLPALVLAFGAIWLRRLPRRLRQGFNAVAIALGAFWLTLAIRHFWRGAEQMASHTMGQGEQYTYTVALLVTGAALFYQSIARGSNALRKAGLVVIGVAVVKVFFVDIGELDGLTRVFSLLFLGLALAGLAWLNRWAATAKDDAV